MVVIFAFNLAKYFSEPQRSVTPLFISGFYTCLVKLDRHYSEIANK